jgi:hypothetical protein
MRTPQSRQTPHTVAVRLTRTERAVAAAFVTGASVDLSRRADRSIRGVALRFILLGGAKSVPGARAALRLSGAHVTGAVALDGAEVGAEVSLEGCVFDEPISLFGGRVRQFALVRSTVPGLKAGNAVVDGNLVLVGSRFAGPVGFGGANVAGSVLLSGAVLGAPGVGLDATSLRVRRDVIAEDGFECRGAIRLDGSTIGGVLSLDGATLGGSGAAVTRRSLAAAGGAAGGLDERAWAGSVACSLRHVSARELTLRPRQRPGGVVDLRHARLGTLRDEPSTWPPGMRLEGLTYEELIPDDCRTRLAWLRLEPGFRPQPYVQLARRHRDAGRDDDARTVLLAGERRRRGTLGRLGRLWGRLQDVTVGYGYRPVRAAVWLLVLFAVGTAVFTVAPPRAVDPATAPPLVPPVYTADLIVPAVDLGQQSAYRAHGATLGLGYALTAVGLVLTTTVATAAARRLRRS